MINQVYSETHVGQTRPTHRSGERDPSRSRSHGRDPRAGAIRRFFAPPVFIERRGGDRWEVIVRDRLVRQTSTFDGALRFAEEYVSRNGGKIVRIFEDGSEAMIKSARDNAKLRRAPASARSTAGLT